MTTDLTTTNTKRIEVVIFLLGFAAGLPAALIAGTLQAWFTEAGLNIYTIGAITLLIAPYNLRFLWAPLFDYLHFPGLDRRRSWMFLTQIGLLITIAIMANLTPLQTITIMGYVVPSLFVVGLATSILAASLEIIVNAYQAEILPAKEHGLSISFYVTGWRLASIFSGALALVLASAFGWRVTYLFMASLISIGLFATFIAPNVEINKSTQLTCSEAIFNPIKDLIARFDVKAIVLFFLLILTYKASDALALALNTTFLLREIGFDLATVGLVNKTISLAASLLGGISAGLLMKKIPLYRALLFFGLIQGISNLSYAVLAYTGKSVTCLVLTAFIENFTSGMGTIALMAMILAMCNTKYTATQIALLSSIAYLARPLVGPVAAIMVAHIGWFLFFIWCFLISLPTLGFIYWNKLPIMELKKE